MVMIGTLLERVAGDWGATEQGMGALCDPSPGAAYHALPATAQLSTAAGEPGYGQRSRRTSPPQVTSDDAYSVKYK